ncbi:hypothetical protein [Sphingobium tyrosinilyticum]
MARFAVFEHVTGCEADPAFQVSSPKTFGLFVFDQPIFLRFDFAA